MLTSLRRIDSPAFEASAAATLRHLMPHFHRAALLRGDGQHRGRAEGSSSDLLNRMASPCLLTDEAGRCIEGNTAFQRVLASVSVRLVLGRVRFADPSLQFRWEKALFETHATAVGRTISATPRGRQWNIHLMPWRSFLAEGLDATDGKLILVLFEERGANSQADAAALIESAKLTGAELEVLAGLMKGFSAKVIANRRRSSFNTVRNQIVSILDKTGHHSQRELIASFGGSVLPDSTQSDDASR
jgi:DNA-binding CsgD family transcriptional regulator